MLDPELKNDSNMFRKLLQNQSKMLPWRLLGGLWGARGLRRRCPELSWSALGGSWGHLGSLLAPLGVVVGLPRCPRRLPEGPREGPGEPPGRHYGTIFAARPAGTEKVREIRNVLDLFDVVFMLFLAVLLRLPRCAGASAHLEKYWFSPGEYCRIRVSAIFARNEKQQNP